LAKIAENNDHNIDPWLCFVNKFWPELIHKINFSKGKPELKEWTIQLTMLTNPAKHFGWPTMTAVMKKVQFFSFIHP
jgi:hypothetical protein